MKNPIPPASGTTITGIAIFLFLGVAVALRHFGFDDEATLADAGASAAVWLIVHPQISNAVVVDPEPPHEPVTNPPVT